MEQSTPKQITAAEHFNNYAAKYEENTGGSTRVVAHHLSKISSPLRSGARLLDNACGTGIMIDEILALVNDREVKESIRITAVDAAPAMIEAIRSKNEARWKFTSDQLSAVALPAEELQSLPDDFFTDSYTNFGFQFFKDPTIAARHLHRTLAPDGTAYATAWADLGYMAAIEKASEEIRPGQPPLTLPFQRDWYTPSHIEKVVRDGGFVDVQVHQQNGRFTAPTVERLAEMLSEGFKTLASMQGWADEDSAKLVDTLPTFLRSLDTLTEDDTGVWIPMLANVAVCKKSDKALTLV
jgi:ubiquinone/menaquinone biosynthesis C-methylase UbiE